MNANTRAAAVQSRMALVLHVAKKLPVCKQNMNIFFFDRKEAGNHRPMQTIFLISVINHINNPTKKTSIKRKLTLATRLAACSVLSVRHVVTKWENLTAFN